MGYVVAFNRDRDSYQVPLALAEHGLLECLVTDLYLPERGPLRGLMTAAGLGHRHARGLDAAKVRWSLPAVLWQVLGPRLGVGRDRVYRRVGDRLSRSALDAAERTGADLFLYSLCAAPAFTSPRSAGMTKGLFMFHPHTTLIRDVLERDFAAHPECAWSMENEADTKAPDAVRDRLDAEWANADFIVCASSFTKASLVHAGCEAARIHVVPYGTAPPAGARPRAVRDDICRFLFVGQGVQRKGLHHLLRAWRAARLPASRLSVIAPVMDPGIARLAPGDVRLLGRQSRAALDEAFAAADVFVMPSLVEGFGLVYLEALAAGCYCIGTANTGLPDLDLPDWAAATVPAGDGAALVQALAHARDLKAEGRLDRAAIGDLAGNLGWPRFREAVALIAREGRVR